MANDDHLSVQELSYKYDGTQPFPGLEKLISQMPVLPSLSPIVTDVIRIARLVWSEVQAKNIPADSFHTVFDAAVNAVYHRKM